MTEPSNGLLTALVFLPAAGAVMIALFGSNARAVRITAAGVMVADLALGLFAWYFMSSADAS